MTAADPPEDSGIRAQSRSFRWISIGALLWALIGVMITYRWRGSVNYDARRWIGFFGTVLPLCATAAAVLIKRRRNFTVAGGLLFLSIGTPTYAAWAINLIPIVLIIALIITVRRARLTALPSR